MGTKKRIAGVLAITLVVGLAALLGWSQAAQHITAVTVERHQTRYGVLLAVGTACTKGHCRRVVQTNLGTDCYTAATAGNLAPCYQVVAAEFHYCGHGEILHRFPGYGSTFPWWVRICTR